MSSRIVFCAASRSGVREALSAWRTGLFSKASRWATVSQSAMIMYVLGWSFSRRSDCPSRPAYSLILGAASVHASSKAPSHPSRTRILSTVRTMIDLLRGGELDATVDVEGGSGDV